MSTLPHGYRERPWRLDDAEAIAALMNAYSMRIWGRDEIEPAALAAQMQLPGLDLEADTRLIIAPDDRIAAVGFVIDLADPHVQVHSAAMVRHDDQGRGLGTRLLDWIESRAGRAVAKAPAGARVSVMQTVDDRDTAACRFLEDRGYGVVRHFWRMTIDLGEDLAAPVWPEGVTVSDFDPEADLRPAFLAGREAFADHWGHVDTPEADAFERFRHRVQTDPDFDPALWFLAREGDEIAGVCYVAPAEGTDRTTGYVRTLGVRPGWRRRGIALALLLHTFIELRDRGFVRCALHVDSESLTGATRLYEKAGMHSSELNHAYEKELRPGADLIRRDVSSP
jgi:GNAT superfamily N-acetyltransferase